MFPVFILIPVFFAGIFFARSAESFVLAPDPFGFNPQETFISAHTLGPFLKVKDKNNPEFGFRPFFSIKRDIMFEKLEMEIVYPFFQYRSNPLGYQAGFIFNLISFGKNFQTPSLSEESFRLYPFIFFRSSKKPERKQVAFAPFYGNFGGRIKFVLFPLYLQTRSEESVSHNILWPVFRFHSGKRKGFRFWPFFGWFEEEKDFRARFFLWPFYFEKKQRREEFHNYYKAIFPFYYTFGYQTESHKIYLWPFFQKSTDPARNLKSLHLPWPFVNFKKSDLETRMRFFPFFEKSETKGLKKTRFFLWPLYTSTKVRFSKYEYSKEKVLLIFKIRREEPFADNKPSSLHIDLWPLFSYKRDERGISYLQMFAPLEPFVGSSTKLYRNYSFLWKVLEVRRKKGVGTSVSVLFGVFNLKKSCAENSFNILGRILGYNSDSSGRKIRFLFLPIGIGNPSNKPGACGG